MSNDFEIKKLADGQIKYTGFLNPAQVAVLLHVHEEIDPAVFDEVEQATVGRLKDAIYKEALTFAEAAHDAGEEVPVPFGQDKEDRLITWYLTHPEYPGTAKQRREAKEAEEAERQAAEAERIAALQAELAELNETGEAEEPAE